MRPAPEHVVVVGLDVVQDQAVELGGGGDGETAIGVQQGDAGQGFFVELACAGKLEAHQVAPAVIHHGRLNVLLAEAKGR